MKRLMWALTGLMLLLAGTVTAWAASMTRGYYMGKNWLGDIIVETPSGKQEFKVNKTIVLAGAGGNKEFSKLRKHTLVQVIHNNGEALEIIVVGVPK